jgi:hypothetical protein
MVGRAWALTAADPVALQWPAWGWTVAAGAYQAGWKLSSSVKHILLIWFVPLWQWGFLNDMLPI